MRILGRKSRFAKHLWVLPLVYSRQLGEKEITTGNPSAPPNEESRPGVSRRLTGAARYPSYPRGISQLLGLANWLISKGRVSRLDGARDAIDLVAPTMGAAVGVVEHAIFG